MLLTGKRVLIVGAEREGVALARMLAAEGAHVTLSDRRSAADLAESLAALANLPIATSLGDNRPEDALHNDLIFVSPGVPPTIPLLARARGHGIPISSQTALFFERCAAPLIGITGSSGKTTTTTLVGDMLRAATASSGRPIYVGGNIGIPLIEQVATIPPHAHVVLELSSFQLEDLSVSPSIAAITNITPNHLDRHGSMESYVQAKSQIVRHQTASHIAIFNADDAYTSSLAPLGAGRVLLWSAAETPPTHHLVAYLDRDCLMLACGEGGVATPPRPVCARADLRVPGRHNVANMLAACVIAACAGAPLSAISAVATSFSGVPHRLEKVASMQGVDYYNDSIASTPERLLAALRVFVGRPIVLIAGGRDKHLPWQEAARAIQDQCRAVLLIGEATGLIADALHAARPTAHDMIARPCADLAEAVRTAHAIAHHGDVVLLSPGCTSYDMYKDFAARGDHFRRLVEDL